jgi:hypothetical protein
MFQHIVSQSLLTSLFFYVQSTLFLLTANTTAFAIIYSIGNIVSIFSLTFVIGIPKQIKTMFAPVRFWATVVYLCMLVITLALSILVRTLFIMVCIANQSLTFFRHRSCTILSCPLSLLLCNSVRWCGTRK